MMLGLFSSVGPFFLGEERRRDWVLAVEVLTASFQALSDGLSPP